ncbi:GHMP kinase [candidate division WWE3 bacterium]|jgi:D-glycero-alpha-D-manno-heptose-7-phosphate kinase|uniref:GHMP kinase n=1 Tax=candidate division WWE3 bacterium TaxID=2053526 RepID=A0A3A4ZA38_UNCKA|nr:MAG: GHMP kinase [candidate division WWE3 bacterium]
MIISKTPLRISFVGGGSDLPSYYQKEYGAVVSTAINKYIYITVNPKFDDKIRASYSVTEMVDTADELKHELIRESLKEMQIKRGIEITSISDIPSKGTGLGSSSSYTVGLLNALKAYKGEIASANYLADTACSIEINRCGKKIGKQDQYAAAYGGINYIKFNPDGSVDVEPVVVTGKKLREIEKNLLMIYTGISRSSNDILIKQSKNVEASPEKRSVMKKMVELADDLRFTLEKKSIEHFGNILDENWELKKRLSDNITNELIDKMYVRAKKHGAYGGKLLGAGGGGFLLLLAPASRHEELRKAFREYKFVNVNFEPAGSRIIFIQE